MEIGKIVLSFVIVGIFHHTLGYSGDEFHQMVPQTYSWISDWALKIQEQSCQVNGRPKAFESWKNGICTIKICIFNSMLGIQDRVQKLVRDQQWGSVLALGLPRIMKCIEPHIDSLETCEAPETRKIDRMNYKLMTGFTYFVGNDTEKLNKMIGSFGSGTGKCLLSKYQDLLVCAEDLITLSSVTMVKRVIGHIHGRSGSRPSSTIGTDWSPSGCQILDTFQTCSVTILNECEDKLIAELLQSLLKYINDEIRCKDFEKSHGSSDRVVNGLFLIVAAVAVIR